MTSEDVTKNGTWTVNVGDDDPHAAAFTDVASAERAAADRSMRSFYRTAYVCRVGGQHIREYADGELVGYLSGSGAWVTDGEDEVSEQEKGRG